MRTVSNINMQTKYLYLQQSIASSTSEFIEVNVAYMYLKYNVFKYDFNALILYLSIYLMILYTFWRYSITLAVCHLFIQSMILSHSYLCLLIYFFHSVWFCSHFFFPLQLSLNPTDLP